MISSLASRFRETLPGLDGSYYNDAEAKILLAQSLLAEHTSSNLELIAHCEATAFKMADLGLDPTVVILALLHHLVLNDSVVLPTEIASLFTANGRNYVRALRACASNPLHEHADFQTSVLNVALAIRQNPEMIPLLLCSGIDSLERSKASGKVVGRDLLLGSPKSPESDLQRYAEDVLDYLVPFAHYFHLDNLVWQIEDSCFAILRPDEYSRIANSFTKHVQQRRRVLDDLQHDLTRCLDEGAIKAKISGRSKSIFSIFRKLNSGDAAPIDLWSIKDLLAVRIVIPDVHGVVRQGDTGQQEQIASACFRVMEAVTSKFALASGSIKDYIHHPQSSGYQAFHFGIRLPRRIVGRSVFAKRLSSVEVQVRTESLHKRAEFGEWSHFLYKLGSPSDFDAVTASKRFWLEQWHGFFTEKIAFRDTTGVLRLIERGATHCDAAYDVIVGDGHPLRITVNEPLAGTFECHIEEPEAVVENCFYERIAPWSKVHCDEIGVPDRAPPASRLVDVSTRKARKGLSTFVQSRASLARQGRAIFAEAEDINRCWAFSMRDSSDGAALAIEKLSAYLRVKVDSIEDFYVRLAQGDFEAGAHQIAMHLRHQFRQEVERIYKNEHLPDRFARWEQRQKSWPDWIRVRTTDLASSTALDVADIPVSATVVLASCCRPLPGDEVIINNPKPATLPKRLTRDFGKEISVLHVLGCPAALSTPAQAYEWRPNSSPQAPTFGQFELVVVDLPGLLNRITEEIGRQGALNIRQSRIYPLFDRSTVIWFEIESRSRSHVEMVYESLERTFRHSYVISAGRRIVRP